MNIAWTSNEPLSWTEYEMLCRAFGLSISHYDHIREEHLDRFARYGYIFKLHETWYTAELSEEQKTMLQI